jgi:heat shock protein HslJ
MAEDAVDVSLGENSAVPVFLEIESPADGATVDISGPVVVSGRGAGLPEGNVVVRALDAGEQVLDEQPATLKGPDVASGGPGTWSAKLRVDVAPGSAGRITAFSPSPVGGHAASATIHVTYGEAPAPENPSLEGPTWVWSKSLPGAEATAQFANGQVSGSAGCNTYSGGYTAGNERGKNTIEFTPLSTTMMMCEESIMESETQFLAGLESATSYVVEGHTLSLNYRGGTLVFHDRDGPQPRDQ